MGVGAGLTSQEERGAEPKTHPLSTRPCLILLCWLVYMQTNAWQRSCVTGPAIKKPKGQKCWGREEGCGEESQQRRRGGGGGWRRQKRRLFFLRNEAAERSRHGKAGEWENGAARGRIAPEAGLPNPNVVLFEQFLSLPPHSSSTK